MSKCFSYLPLVLLLLSSSASAHLLKVFAWMEGQQIVGNAYFAGGIAAGGANILIFGRQQQPLAQLHPEADGSFRVTVPYSEGYAIEANTGDGHVAHWQIPAAEVTSGKTAATPKTTKQPTSLPAKPFNILAEPPSTASAQGVDCAQLTDAIQTAVAKEIGPLRMELQQAESRAKLSDVIGGLGFIFGIAGIALWWQSRKR
ncbi:hypothetical protein [Shewanella sp.]|uniref:hypothetical protein n=1 Tax=Shewanella sp. TaxID=50422 RepID=UPI003A970978